MFLAFIIRIKLLEKLDYFNNIFSSSYWLVLHDTIDEIPNQLNFYLSETRGIYYKSTQQLFVMIHLSYVHSTKMS